MEIQLNKQLDKEVYMAFREGFAGGVDFGKKIRADHPGITKDNCGDYIDAFYSAHEHELAVVLEETIKCFDEIKDAIFSELQRYFGHDYRAEKYTCYLSIFDCNPRYIETKTFQVYYKRPYHLRKEVIAHELTHFAFYDFCHRLGIGDEHGDSTKDGNSKALWELSEIFNVLFLNIPSLQKAIGAEELLFYPTLKEKLEQVRNIWDKKLKAEEFIKTSLDNIK